MRTILVAALCLSSLLSLALWPSTARAAQHPAPSSIPVSGPPAALRQVGEYDSRASASLLAGGSGNESTCPRPWPTRSDNAPPSGPRTTLRLGFPPDAAPLSFAGADGCPEGLAAAWLSQVDVPGVDFDVRRVHDDYELRQAARSGQLDALLAVPRDAAGLGEGWMFSTPFLSVPNVIVAGHAQAALMRLEDLAGKRVLLSDPQRLRAPVLARAPSARIIVARSTAQALQRLLDGEADAFIGSQPVVDRLLRERFRSGLQVVAPAGFDDALALAVRPGHAGILAAFNERLHALPVATREALRTAWVTPLDAASPRGWPLWQWSTGGLLLGGTGVVVFVLGRQRIRRIRAGRRMLEQRLGDVAAALPAIVYQMRWSEARGLAFSYVAGDPTPLLGVGAQQIMAAPQCLLEAIDPRDRGNVRQSIEDAAGRFLPLALEFRVGSGEGSRWIRSQAQPHASEPGKVTWSGYWIDVTASRMQTDALVQARIAAERAAQAKSRFLAMMSHEIRTPMSGVLGLLDRLGRQPLPQDQAQAVQEAESAARQIGGMLDAILEFARLDAGAMTLDPLPFSLPALLEAVRLRSQALAAANACRVRIQCDPALAPAHGGDPSALGQVVEGLLCIALRAHAGDAVALQLEVQAESPPGRQSVVLRLMPDVVGIVDGIAGRLPDPAPKDPVEDRWTEMELGNHRHLLGLMGGTLHVGSPDGVVAGMALRLTLPITSADDLGWATTGEATVGSLSGAAVDARLLVVDPHPIARAVIGWQLRQLGLVPTLAGDMESALARLSEDPQDLILIACDLPTLDGGVLARLIREREEREGLPRHVLLGMTAQPQQVARLGWIEAGMDAVLPLPLSIAHLRACVQRHVR